MSGPLELFLAAIPEYRVPPSDAERLLERGYRLRLDDGRLLDPSDPLLQALGAEISSVVRGGTHEGALQADWIEPGAPLALELEGYDEDGDAIVGVWDEPRERCAGHLRLASAARAAALIEMGVEPAALALSEMRSLGEDRRTSLEVLCHLPATLVVSSEGIAPLPRNALRAPRRIVLCADGAGCIRAWDPAADSGPAAVDELPVSVELKTELDRLRSDGESLGEDPEEELFEREFARGAIEQRSLELWQRARRELGRRYSVGFLGPDMERPIWSPAELAEPEDETAAF